MQGDEHVKIAPGYGYYLNRVYIRIPVERVGVLIGEKGEVKRQLEQATGTVITVDSVNGSVVIEAVSPETASEGLLKAQEVVKAIGIGFSPEKAFRLLDEDQILITIDLKEVFGSRNQHITRVKGRIIGEKGKTRKIIEETTGTYVCVGENVIGIIGDYEQAEIAKQAINMLIEGRPHSAVYAFLEREARRLKRRRLTSLWR